MSFKISRVAGAGLDGPGLDGRSRSDLQDKAETAAVRPWIPKRLSIRIFFNPGGFLTGEGRKKLDNLSKFLLRNSGTKKVSVFHSDYNKLT